MRLDQISRKDVRELISRKLQVDKVSRSTVRNILTPLREMLGHATDEEILKANPATNAGRFMREKRIPDQPHDDRPAHTRGI